MYLDPYLLDSIIWLLSTIWWWSLSDFLMNRVKSQNWICIVSHHFFSFEPKSRSDSRCDWNLKRALSVFAPSIVSFLWMRLLKAAHLEIGYSQTILEAKPELQYKCYSKWDSWGSKLPPTNAVFSTKLFSYHWLTEIELTENLIISRHKIQFSLSNLCTSYCGWFLIRIKNYKTDQCALHI